MLKLRENSRILISLAALRENGVSIWLCTVRLHAYSESSARQCCYLLKYKRTRPQVFHVFWGDVLISDDHTANIFCRTCHHVRGEEKRDEELHQRLLRVADCEIVLPSSDHARGSKNSNQLEEPEKPDDAHHFQVVHRRKAQNQYDLRNRPALQAVTWPMYNCELTTPGVAEGGPLSAYLSPQLCHLFFNEICEDGMMMQISVCAFHKALNRTSRRRYRQEQTVRNQGDKCLPTCSIRLHWLQSFTNFKMYEQNKKDI